MEKDLYVLVDKDLHEIWCNEFGGCLMPMTRQDIIEYFCPHYLGAEATLQEEINHKYNMVHELSAGTETIVVYKCLDKKCPHCSKPLVKSDTEGYDYQCFYCDEDFYECEV
jgi:hypothetical protein